MVTFTSFETSIHPSCSLFIFTKLVYSLNTCGLFNLIWLLYIGSFIFLKFIYCITTCILLNLISHIYCSFIFPESVFDHFLLPTLLYSYSLVISFIAHQFVYSVTTCTLLNLLYLRSLMVLKFTYSISTCGPLNPIRLVNRWGSLSRCVGLWLTLTSSTHTSPTGSPGPLRKRTVSVNFWSAAASRPSWV